MNLKNNSVTLTELIVGVVVIGIIMAGIIGIELSMRRAYFGTTRNALITMRASAIMHDITLRISHATDIIGAAGGDDTLWVRVDDNMTPADFTDDPWYCYDWITPAADPRQVRVCQVANEGVDDCDAPTNTPEILGDANTFIAKFVSIENVAAPENNELYVEIEIVNRFDINEPEDPTRNPEYQLISRINPPISFW